MLRPSVGFVPLHAVPRTGASARRAVRRLLPGKERANEAEAEAEAEEAEEPEQWNVWPWHREGEWAAWNAAAIFVGLFFLGWVGYGWFAVFGNFFHGTPGLLPSRLVFAGYPYYSLLAPALVLWTLASCNCTRRTPRWYATWGNGCGAALPIVGSVWAFAIVIGLAVARHGAFDINGCVWACPKNENCHAAGTRVRAPRVRVDGRNLSNWLLGQRVPLRGEPPMNVYPEADGHSFRVELPLFLGVEANNTPEPGTIATATYTHVAAGSAVVIVLGPERILEADDFVPKGVATLRIDTPEPLYSSNGFPMKINDIDDGVPRSEVRRRMGRITGVPPDMGEMALNAEVGEAVLGALKPMLIARGKTRFVAAGCSRGGKQALRFGLVSEHLDAVLAVDAGTLGDTIDSLLDPCGEGVETLCHPDRWHRWARQGLWPGSMGWLPGLRFEGDVDSMVADVVLRGVQVHVRSGGMRGYASYRSYKEWIESEGSLPPKYLTRTISIDGEHCTLKDPATLMRLEHFVLGENLDALLPGPDDDTAELWRVKPAEVGVVEAWLKGEIPSGT